MIMLDDERLFLRFAAIPFGSGFCDCCRWHVHPFVSADEAFDFYTAHASQIDLLLTDFHMPEITGLEFISKVRSVPTARVGLLPALVVSSDPPAAATLPPLVSSVRKPFTKSDIATGLRDVRALCTGRASEVSAFSATSASMSVYAARAVG